MNSRTIWICAALIAAPCAAFAASPFDGTWKTSLNQIHLSKKPESYVITDSSYTCSSCTPAYTVKADGTDQPVKGHDIDTIAATVKPDSLALVGKLKGKTLWNSKYTLSADGKTVTEEYTQNYGSEPVTYKVAHTQVTPPAAGESGFSGSWVMSKVLSSSSDAGLLQTLGMTDDGFTSSSNGQSYDAKFDGKKYPVTGDPAGTLVVLKKLGPSSVEESDYQHGKLVEVERYTVSADGKTLHIVDTHLPENRTNRFMATKQ